MLGADSPVGCFLLITCFTCFVCICCQGGRERKRKGVSLTNQNRWVILCFMEIKYGLHPPALLPDGPCGGWLSGPSQAGNLRILMLGGQFYATPSLLSPGAWIWSPLPAAVSGPLPPSSSLPPARLTEPQSPHLLVPLRLHPGIDFPSPDSVWPGLVKYLDRWVDFGRCQVHVCRSMGWGRGKEAGRKWEKVKAFRVDILKRPPETTLSNVGQRGTEASGHSALI